MAGKTTFQIVIPRRSNQCTLGEGKFSSGDVYFSLVVEGEDEALERRDYCKSCWSKAEKKGSTYWKGKVPEKKEKAKYADLGRDDRALAILRDRLQEDDDSAREEAFVLSLYLARLRKLLVRKVVKGSQLYEVSGTEEILAVPQIPLSSLQVQAVQKKIAEQLSPKAV